MGKLGAAQRNKLPTSDFALPGLRKYPVNDPGHARAALSRAAHNATPEQQMQIKAKVRRKFPSIAVEGEPSKPRSDRKKR
jgi:hypothetical protein